MLIQIILILLAMTAVVYIYKQYKTENEELKKAAVYLGLFIFICGLVVPRLEQVYFERQRNVLASSSNIYTIDLKNDFNEIKQKLDVNGNAKIEDFDTDFEDSGAIKKLEYKIITKDNEGFILYNVSFSSNKYTIKPIRVKEWLQYDRLIDEEQFFYAFGYLDLKRTKPVKKYPYYTAKCDGDYTNWEVKDWDNFLIIDNGPKKLKNAELPVSGYVFCIFGNKSNGGNSYVSDDSMAYILPM